MGFAWGWLAGLTKQQRFPGHTYLGLGWLSQLELQVEEAMTFTEPLAKPRGMAP